MGYLPWLLRSEAPHAKYLQLAAKYGDVTSLTLGRNLVVCLGSVRMIRELFTRHDSIGRPHTPLNNLLGGRGEYHIFVSTQSLQNSSVLWI